MFMTLSSEGFVRSLPDILKTEKIMSLSNAYATCGTYQHIGS